MSIRNRTTSLVLCSLYSRERNDKRRREGDEELREEYNRIRESNWYRVIKLSSRHHPVARSKWRNAVFLYRHSFCPDGFRKMENRVDSPFFSQRFYRRGCNLQFVRLTGSLSLPLSLSVQRNTPTVICERLSRTSSRATRSRARIKFSLFVLATLLSRVAAIS